MREYIVRIYFSGAHTVTVEAENAIDAEMQAEAMWNPLAIDADYSLEEIEVEDEEW